MRKPALMVAFAATLGAAMTLISQTPPASPPPSSSTQYAERFTSKDGKTYLGFKASTSTFMTCARVQLQIEGGTVVSTKEKCPSPTDKIRIWSVVLPPVPGVIQKVDTKTGTFTIADANGKTLEWFVAPNAKSEIPLEKFKAGDKVIVGGPTSGRAEILTLDNTAGRNTRSGITPAPTRGTVAAQPAVRPGNTTGGR